jgi:phenylalanyl-tRNA synthetase alpha chain
MTEPVQLVDSLERIEGEGLASIEAAGSLEELEALRVRYLGRSGDLAGMLSRIGQAPAEDRRAIGQAANTAKRRLQEAHASRQTALERAESVGVAQADLTMPGRRAWEGGVHPVTRVIDEILEIFRELGFSKVRGPEAETEWYNFQALNIPLEHPAADMWDTFYLADGVVLRSHTGRGSRSVLPA